MSGPMKETDWRAEEDAYSLIRAEEILADKNRTAKARKAAKKLAVEKENAAKAAKKVARRGTGGKGKK